MKRVFKYYLSVLFVVVSVIGPIPLLTSLGTDAGGGIASIFALLGGGGLVYAIGALFFETYNDNRWTQEEKTRKMPLLAIISSGVALLLHIIILLCYEDASLFAVYNFVVDFKGDVLEFFLRFLAIIASCIAVFPLYTIATSQVDTTIYEWEITTYWGEIEIDKEYVSHSYEDSKISWFFITLFVACAGVMSSSLPVMLIVLALNLSAFLKGKWKKVFLILSVIASAVLTVIATVNLFTVGNIKDADLVSKIAVELLPLVFVGLTALFFKGYFKHEWMGTILALILGIFYMIFASWLVSFGLSAGIVGLVSLF